MKEFNTTAVCIPSKHYMVDITERIKSIKQLVDDGKYFTINRARQYGKTTTLNALAAYLSSSYDVLSIDFQDVTDALFISENDYVKGLAKLLCDLKDTVEAPINSDIYDDLNSLGRLDGEANLNDLFRIFDSWARENEKPLVLIIDEVDNPANKKVFLDFLGKLRSSYLKRETNPKYKTFQSVILAGVTDIKHLKSKIRDDDSQETNSPWNIATDFNIDMSLTQEGIYGMLLDYENDHNTGMDIDAISRLIYEYTNGYPYLVSRICQLIDVIIAPQMNSIENAWTKQGVEEAVKRILSDGNDTLFQSLINKLDNLTQIRESIRSVLMEGIKLAYNPDQPEISIMEMYGFIRNDHNTVRIANRIFETRLYNYFLSNEEIKSNIFSKEGDFGKSIFVQDSKLNMPLIMEHFISTYNEVFGPLEDKFKEKDGRELFLLYLKPIINGTGNYYIEAQTRDQTRTDIIIDYLGNQYIVEMKIWRGQSYNEAGEQQISEYLDYFNLTTGYMLSFNFNKKKEVGVRRVEIGNKVLFEGML